MQFQPNPYLIWLLIPGLITFGIGLYTQTRPIKKRESFAFSILMFGGAGWAFANLMQLLSPDATWQIVWNRIVFLGVMSAPTAFFLVAVKLTGFGRERVEKVEKWLWILPTLIYLSLITNPLHHGFYTSFKMDTTGGFANLVNQFGPLFYVHAAYSYALLLGGMLILVISVVRDFKHYGLQGFALILGVLAPFVGNIFYLFGSLPPGFPDPTPLMFIITGLAFGWAIFAGGLLEVVPLAHDRIVRQLSNGILILDSDRNLRDINPAACGMLGLSSTPVPGSPLADVLNGLPEVAGILQEKLDASSEHVFQIRIPASKRSLDITISMISSRRQELAGWLLQLNDISQRVKVEANLAATRSAYESLLDTIQDVYFEADRNGTIIFVNQAFWQLLGYAGRQEVLGKNYRHFIARESIREVTMHFQQVFLDSQSIQRFDYLYKRKDGSLHTAEMVFSPFFEDGEVVGTRGTIRDIDLRVKAEGELREARDAAEYRASALAAINRVAEKVSRSLDLQDNLQLVCRELTGIFPIRNAGIGLLTPDRSALQIIAFHTPDPAEKSAQGLLLPVEGNASTQEVIATKNILVIQDAQHDPRTQLIAETSKARGTKSIMIVPLLARDEVIGTIGMPARDSDYIFSQHEIELAKTIASQIAASIDNARLYERVESALGLVEHDLEIGREIQAGFFPEKLPNLPGWEIAAHFHPARQVAGDFYDVFQLKDSRFTSFIIADVCDKGVGAALFMVLFRSLLRAFSEVSITSENIREQLLKIILSTNNFIAIYHGRSNMFATLFYGILDPESGVLYYVNGGHEPPVILGADGTLLQRLEPTGPAVGLFPNMEFRVEEATLEKGAVLVAFTDGTTDAKNASGELFTEERLLKEICSPWTSVFSMLFELKIALSKHIGGQPQFDDITLISFRRKLQPGTDLHAICRPAVIEILDELHDFIESAANNNGLIHDRMFEFKLAMEEAVVNIIQHGYEDRLPGLLSLFFEVEAQRARLVIRDDGQYFPPEQAQTPDLEAGWEERAAGGLGIFLIKELMDTVSYRRDDGGYNEMILEKDLR